MFPLLQHAFVRLIRLPDSVIHAQSGCCTAVEEDRNLEHSPTQAMSLLHPSSLPSLVVRHAHDISKHNIGRRYLKSRPS